MEQLDKWQQEIERLSYFEENAVNKKLFKYYRQALIDIKKEMKVFMDNYETLSFSKRLEAERLLENGKQIDKILRDMNKEVNNTIEKYVHDSAECGYYGNWYAIEGITGVHLDMNMLPENYIKELVHHPVKGHRFSSRLYKHRNRLAKETTAALLDAARTGKSYAVAAKRINEMTEASYKKALRIARTEGGRVQSTTKQRSYAEAKKKGVDIQKMWMSTLDGRTRHSHQHLDGQIVDIEDKFVSEDGYEADAPMLFGVAKEDINCRCTDVAVVNGIKPELRTDNLYGETFPYKNYNEWKQDRIDRYGQKKWDIDVKKDRYKTTDRVQYEKYRQLLGRNAPKNLDTFQELKYNDGSEWLKLQDNYFVKVRLKDGRYGSTINPEKQAPHIESTKEDGKSYFYDNVDVQKVFDKYAGTGRMEKDRNGKRKNTEVITVDDIIGVAVYEKGTYETNEIKIHHSKKRTHIVPIKL